jgi:hypothetical protein
MAIHKRHSNGNILVTASDEGRVLETSKDGRLLWEYVIVVDEGRAGRVTGAVLLPGHMDVDDFASKKAQCRDIDEQLYVK